MAIVVNANLRDVDASGNNFIYVCVPLTFSGNYSTGGDTLDITTVIKDLPTQEVISMFAEGNSSNAAAQSVIGGYYVTVGMPGPFGGVNATNGVAATGPASWKLEIWNAGGTQFTAGAYTTAITSDYVTLNILLRKEGAL